MIRESDLDKIIEDIKDIFYSEVDVECLQIDASVHTEVNEGRFFFKLEDYLKDLLNNNENKKVILPTDIDYNLIQKGINYRTSLSFVRNRGYGWEIPNIQDFENLTPIQKSKFTEDIFWSSTSYDEESMWCFSFVKNKKIVMNKGFYCNLCLKRISYDE
jgi:hypothetical protein